MKNDDYWLDLLKHNKGFESPISDQWVEYAKTHNFQGIKAEKIFKCPDCGCGIFSPVDQYIYYSTLITLQYCNHCGLYYSDTHIDPSIIAQHFESTYKDEFYFLNQRKDIFDYISYIADIYSPQRGKILDIGGGKGHLLANLSKRRPDLDLTLNDMSKKSCNYVIKNYGFKTICGPSSYLTKTPNKFDVILLIDVIYYEPDIIKMWNAVDTILNNAGTLIIRIPNKLGLIRLNQKWNKIININKHTDNQNITIKFFNPEHIYIFSRSYLYNRLKQLDFNEFVVYPSPLLSKKQSHAQMNPIYHLYFRISKLICKFSFKKLILTPSLILVANR